MRSGDSSFNPKTRRTVRVDLRGSRYEYSQRRRSFLNEAVERREAMPGVVSASVFTTPPLSNNETIWREFVINGRPTLPHERHAVVQTVSANFFRTMGLTVLEGRGFAKSDRESSMPVPILSEKLAG